MTNRHPDHIAARIRALLESTLYYDTMGAAGVGAYPFDLVRVGVDVDGKSRCELHEKRSAISTLEAISDDFGRLREILEVDGPVPLDLVVVVDGGVAYARLQTFTPRSAPMPVPNWVALAAIRDEESTQVDPVRVGEIAASILAGDVQETVILDQEDRVVEGHHTISAAKQAGLTHVDAVRISLSRATDIRRYGKRREERHHSVDRIATSRCLLAAEAA
jgi:hypothetical protein